MTDATWVIVPRMLDEETWSAISDAIRDEIELQSSTAKALGRSPAHSVEGFAHAAYTAMVAAAPPLPDELVERMARAHHECLGAMFDIKRSWDEMTEIYRGSHVAALRAALAVLGAST